VASKEALVFEIISIINVDNIDIYDIFYLQCFLSIARRSSSIV